MFFLDAAAEAVSLQQVTLGTVAQAMAGVRRSLKRARELPESPSLTTAAPAAAAVASAAAAKPPEPKDPQE